MYHSNIRESGHVWEKQNLVTKPGRKGHYDEMKCANCGIKGRRYGFDTVEISGSYSQKNALKCPKSLDPVIPTEIEIVFCSAYGEKFKNLIPGSKHKVVTPPDGYKNDRTGVWVMGIGEPVRVLTREFKDSSPPLSPSNNS